MKIKDPDLLFYLIFLLGISIPFSDYSMMTKAVLVLGAYVLIFRRHELRRIISTHRRFILFLSMPLWLALAWILYSPDLADALNYTGRLAPLLLIPLGVLACRARRKDYKILADAFAWAVTAAFGIGLAGFIWFKWNGWGNYSFYLPFAMFLNKHTTYFSLMVVVMMIHALYFLGQETRSQQLKYLFFLAAGLGMLSLLRTRIALLALAVATLIWAWGGRKQTNESPGIRLLRMGLPVIILLAGAAVWWARNPLEQHKDGTRSLNDIHYRLQHWQAVIHTSAKKITTGYGPGQHREALTMEYRRRGLHQAALEHYNAHNQFLEMLYRYGITGLLWWLVAAGGLAYIFLRRADELGWMLLAVMLIFMLTESTLERLSGIVMWALWLSLYYRFHIATADENPDNS